MYAKSIGKKTELWHNISARRLDAPLIQAAGILFWMI
jgi:hypothetical protein